MKVKIKAKLGQANSNVCPPGMRVGRVLKRGVMTCRLKDHLTRQEVNWLKLNAPEISEKELYRRLIR